MHCTKCGTQIPDGTPFCSACGAPTTPVADASTENASPNPQAATPFAGAQTQPSHQSHQPSQPPYNASQPPYQQPQPPYKASQPPYQQPQHPYNASQLPYQPPQPPYNASQPAYQQPQPPYPAAPPRKKKGCAGCLVVLLVLFLIVAGGLFYLFGSLSLFKPKDLGVRYDDRDFQQAMDKTGVQIDAVLKQEDLGDRKRAFLKAGATETADGDVAVDPDTVLELFGSRGKTETLDPNDYTWEFSDYQPKTFTMTGEEASAFFNEMAPAFWWFKDSQIKVEPDGTILTSSKVDIAGVLTFLFRDVAEEIPVTLPGKANLYTEGRIGIVDNQIHMDPEFIQIGPAKIPEEYLEEDVVEGVSMFLNRFITMIPGLQINRIEERDGSFDVDAIIPQKVTVRPK